MKFVYNFLILGLVLFLGADMAYAQKNETRKVALLISAENGGPGRTALKYSHADVISINNILSRLAGILPSDIYILKNPDKKELMDQINFIRESAAIAHNQYKKTEFILYYSGHSDEVGMLLENEKFTYEEIRKTVKELPFDLKIIILDSCSSGALTRAKGGKRRAPFIYNPAYDMRGEAYLTSSSSDEVSQESDKIKASFFTYYLVSGLYGAADFNKDLQVTLSEAYQYAYSKTLERTEKLLSGPQHPNFDITMSGTGDVVMTNLHSSKSLLVLNKNISGQLFIRDSSNVLVTEIEKQSGQVISLGIPEGSYVITLIKPDKLLQLNLAVTGKNKTISEEDFSITSTDSKDIARYKGENIPAPDSETAQSENPQDGMDSWLSKFSFQFLPEYNPYRPPTMFSLFMIGGYLTDSELLSLAGVLSIVGNDMKGFQFSGISNFTGGNSDGLQSAGILNLNLHNTRGVQAAGILNVNGGSFSGLQLAGIANYNKFSFDGPQISSILNITGSVNGGQFSGIGNFSSFVSGTQIAGIFNFANSVKGSQLGGIINYSREIEGFKAGLINISETGNSPMIGLINLYLKETHNADLWMDETGFIKAAYRNSTRNFHFLYGAGTNVTAFSKTALFTGLGVHFPIKESFTIGMDYIINFIASKFSENNSFNALDYNNVHQFRLSFDIRFHKHFTLFAGAGISYAWNIGNGQIFEPEFVRSYQNGKFKMWPGFFVGARF